MINQFAEWYARKQVLAGLISEDEIELYQYGYILVIETGVNVLISVVLAVLLGQVPCLILFSCIFIPLRIYCGGWHAPKAWLCLILSNAMIVFVLLIQKYDLLNVSLPVMLVMEAVGFVCVFVFAPAENKNKLLNIKEKKAYCIKSRIIYGVQIGLALLFFVYKNKFIVDTIMLAHIFAIFSMIAGKYSFYRRKRESL